MQTYSAEVNISALVTKWELQNPDILAPFLASRREKTRKLKNKFAALNKGDGYIERLLYELPEPLDQLLQTSLSIEDKAFLRSLPGAKWFAKSFRQYTVPEKL